MKNQDFNKLMEETKEAIEFAKQAPIQGSPIYVTKTDTIKAKYAKMPIVSLSQEYLVEILEPVLMVATVKSVIFSPKVVGAPTLEEKLKELLLDEWHEQFRGQIRKIKNTESAWMLEVDKVELIECDLLVPKK